MKIFKLILTLMVLSLMLFISPKEKIDQSIVINESEFSYAANLILSQDKVVQSTISSYPSKLKINLENPFSFLVTFSSLNDALSIKKNPATYLKGDATGFLQVIKYQSNYT